MTQNPTVFSPPCHSQLVMGVRDMSPSMNVQSDGLIGPNLGGLSQRRRLQPPSRHVPQAVRVANEATRAKSAVRAEEVAGPTASASASRATSWYAETCASTAGRTR